MRLIAGFGGLLLVGLGVYFCVRLFFFAAVLFEKPDEMKPALDRWEIVVRSRAYDEILAREQPAGTQLTPTTSRENPDGGELAERRENVEAVTKSMIELIGAGARPIAIFIMITVGLLLVRIALALCSIGIQMMQLLNPDERILKRLVDRLNRR